MGRDTRTGWVLEQMVLPSLHRGGYSYKLRVKVGQRLGCGAHYVDVIAEKAGNNILVSLKWQQVSGTAEQKIPFEVICLAETLAAGGYTRAYVVLGGEGWSLRKFYVEGGYQDTSGMRRRLELLLWRASWQGRIVGNFEF